MLTANRLVADHAFHCVNGFFDGEGEGGVGVGIVG